MGTKWSVQILRNIARLKNNLLHNDNLIVSRGLQRRSGKIGKPFTLFHWKVLKKLPILDAFRTQSVIQGLTLYLQPPPPHTHAVHPRPYLPTYVVLVIFLFRPECITSAWVWQFVTLMAGIGKEFFFSVLLPNQTGSGAHPAVQIGWSVKLTTQFHLLPRLRTRGAVPLLSLHVFSVWTGKT